MLNKIGGSLRTSHNIRRPPVLGSILDYRNRPKTRLIDLNLNMRQIREKQTRNLARTIDFDSNQEDHFLQRRLFEDKQKEIIAINQNFTKIQMNKRRLREITLSSMHKTNRMLSDKVIY